MNDLVLACALLEIWNACQSFALQALLSGGFDDTPLDLVKWKARLRMFRVPIDAGTFILRLFTHIHLYLLTHANIHTYIHTHTYILIHTYTHAYIYSYVHIKMCIMDRIQTSICINFPSEKSV